MLPASNRAVLNYLHECVTAQKMRGPIAATIHEFEDCTYSVKSSSEDSEVIILSFSHPYELNRPSQEHAMQAYGGIAEVGASGQESYQISLKVRVALHRPFNALCSSALPLGAM